VAAKSDGAFSGKVGAGFPSENATTTEDRAFSVSNETENALEAEKPPGRWMRELNLRRLDRGARLLDLTEV
jgi:hypothetical protein